MKRIVTASLFILFTIPAFAQKIEFDNSTNKWSLLDSTIGCCIPYPVQYNISYYDSTTVVNYNGHTYQYLINTVASFLTRQEAGRVYFLDRIDSLDRVLYDFNLGLNDTIHTVYPNDTFAAWVAAIDSTQLSGIWYKVWHFNGIGRNSYFPDSARSFQYNVIEGIGCTNGPYYPASPYSLTAFSQHLLCFNNNMGVSTSLSNPVAALAFDYTSYYDNGLSCADYESNHNGHGPVIMSNVGVPEVSGKHNTATLLPNPANESSRIVFSSVITSGTVVLTNELGQIIATLPVQNKQEITIGDKIKVPGMYYYRVTDHISSETFSGKFITQ